MKLCFPNFGALGLVLETLCRQEKLDYTKPSQNLEEALVLGSRMSPEGVCLPMKRILGEFLQAAEQGADTALFLGGSGPCRFGYFAPLFQTIFDQNHINLRVVAMEAPSGNRIGFLRELAYIIGCSEKRAARLLLSGWNALRWLDRWEETRLSALAVYGITGPRAQSAESFRQLTIQLQEWCKTWQLKSPQEVIQVGIIGDIYTTIDTAINHELQEELARLGIMTKRSISLSRHLVHTVFGNRRQQAAAKPYLPRPIGGFAVETIGAGRQFIQKNFDGLIQVYPLSCMPEIVADGILSGMQQEYNMPVLRLVIDEHSGRAGNQTRIEAFADMLKQRKKMNGEKQKTKEKTGGKAHEGILFGYRHGVCEHEPGADGAGSRHRP